MKKLLKSLLAVMLISMMAISFTSCAPKAEKVKENLEKAGYTVMLFEGDDAEEYDEGVTAVLTAVKGLDYKNSITIVWYANADDAKKAEEEAKEELKEMGDEGADYVVKRSGKCVWMGHKDAVKAM
ncbi:MAG: hypothetical protein IKA61_04465 [Clostridia bacterium]|nr:hypothetical protein [Clostridia bacterium]